MSNASTAFQSTINLQIYDFDVTPRLIKINDVFKMEVTLVYERILGVYKVVLNSNYRVKNSSIYDGIKYYDVCPGDKIIVFKKTSSYDYEMIIYDVSENGDITVTGQMYVDYKFWKIKKFRKAYKLALFYLR